jgi:hypothetical protein
MRHRDPELLQSIRGVGMLRSVDAKLIIVGLMGEFFGFRIVSLCIQGGGEVGLHFQGAGVFRSLNTSLSRQNLSL